MERWLRTPAHKTMVVSALLEYQRPHLRGPARPTNLAFDRHPSSVSIVWSLLQVHGRWLRLSATRRSRIYDGTRMVRNLTIVLVMEYGSRKGPPLMWLIRSLGKRTQHRYCACTSCKAREAMSNKQLSAGFLTMALFGYWTGQSS